MMQSPSMSRLCSHLVLLAVSVQQLDVYMASQPACEDRNGECTEHVSEPARTVQIAGLHIRNGYKFR